MPQDQDDIKGTDAMKQAPTPGPLSGDDVKLLVKGDLLRFDHALGNPIAAFKDTTNGVVLYATGDNDMEYRAHPHAVSFIGRPDADGWMPWFGETKGPVDGTGMVCDFIMSDGREYLGQKAPRFWHLVSKWRPSLAPTAPVEASGSELLPCPFCGGEAEIVHLDDGDNVGGSCVCCTKCQASGNVEFERKENFVENWNRRAVFRPQPSGETRKALDRLKMAAHVYEDDEMAADCATLEALLSARPAPVASGGQHSSAIDFPPDDVLACVPVEALTVQDRADYFGSWLVEECASCRGTGCNACGDDGVVRSWEPDQ